MARQRYIAPEDTLGPEDSISYGGGTPTIRRGFHVGSAGANRQSAFVSNEALAPAPEPLSVFARAGITTPAHFEQYQRIVRGARNTGQDPWDVAHEGVKPRPENRYNPNAQATNPFTGNPYGSADEMALMRNVLGDPERGREASAHLAAQPDPYQARFLERLANPGQRDTLEPQHLLFKTSYSENPSALDPRMKDKYKAEQKKWQTLISKWSAQHESANADDVMNAVSEWESQGGGLYDKTISDALSTHFGQSPAWSEIQKRKEQYGAKAQKISEADRDPLTGYTLPALNLDAKGRAEVEVNRHNLERLARNTAAQVSPAQLEKMGIFMGDTTSATPMTAADALKEFNDYWGRPLSKTEQSQGIQARMQPTGSFIETTGATGTNRDTITRDPITGATAMESDYTRKKVLSDLQKIVTDPEQTADRKARAQKILDDENAQNAVDANEILNNQGVQRAMNAGATAITTPPSPATQRAAPVAQDVPQMAPVETWTASGNNYARKNGLVYRKNEKTGEWHPTGEGAALQAAKGIGSSAVRNAPAIGSFLNEIYNQFIGTKMVKGLGKTAGTAYESARQRIKKPAPALSKKDRRALEAL